MRMLISLFTTHRPEGGAPTKSVQPSFWGRTPTKSVHFPCGSGAPAAMSVLHTTPIAPSP
jgi:hypothetical protein